MLQNEIYGTKSFYVSIEDGCSRMRRYIVTEEVNCFIVWEKTFCHENNFERYVEFMVFVYNDYDQHAQRNDSIEEAYNAYRVGLAEALKVQVK